MLDNLSKYVYEVYRCKSVSAAAKKLYLSQPALSTAIKKAEDELGAAIFNRKTIPFTLTAEGKIYIETIEKILLLEQQTHDRIQDMLSKGTTDLAFTPAEDNTPGFTTIPLIEENLVVAARRDYPGI